MTRFIIIQVLLVVITMRPGESTVTNTSPGRAVEVEYGENGTLICTYEGVSASQEITVTFRKYSYLLWRYNGNSTHAKVDAVNPQYSGYNLMRVNKGYEQFNMTLQFTNVSRTDMDSTGYNCIVTADGHNYHSPVSTALVVVVPPMDLQLTASLQYKQAVCKVGLVKPVEEANFVLMNDTQFLTSTPYENRRDYVKKHTARYLQFSRYDNLQDWLYCNVTWRGRVYSTRLTSPLEVPFAPLTATLDDATHLPVPEGHYKLFTCILGSSYPRGSSTVRWYKGTTNPIRLNEPNVNITMEYRNSSWGGQEVVSTMGWLVQRSSDTKSYSCYAYYNRVYPDKDSTTLNVTWPASDVHIESLKSVHHEGDFLALTCFASGGKPEVYTFYWRHRAFGQETWTDLPRRRDAYMWVSPLSPADSGTYECEAVNHGGSFRDEITVQVEYPPKVNPAALKVYSNAGEELTTGIEVQSYPPPAAINCSMNHLNQVIQLNDTDSNNHTSLILSSVVSGNLGRENYRVEMVFHDVYGVIHCMIGNDGRQETPFEIISKMYGKPDAPSDLNITSVTTSSMLVTWQPGEDDGGYEQTFMVTLRSTLGQEQYSTASKTSILIDNLEAATSYEVSVVATNRLGTSSTVTATRITLDIPPPLSEAQSQGSSPNAAIIALAVVLSLAIAIIICLVVFVVIMWKRGGWRQAKDDGDGERHDVSPQPQLEDPMDHYDDIGDVATLPGKTARKQRLHSRKALPGKTARKQRLHSRKAKQSAIYALANDAKGLPVHDYYNLKAMDQTSNNNSNITSKSDANPASSPTPSIPKPSSPKPSSPKPSRPKPSSPKPSSLKPSSLKTSCPKPTSNGIGEMKDPMSPDGHNTPTPESLPHDVIYSEVHKPKHKMKKSKDAKEKKPQPSSSPRPNGTRNGHGTPTGTPAGAHKETEASPRVKNGRRIKRAPGNNLPATAPKPADGTYINTEAGRPVIMPSSDPEQTVYDEVYIPCSDVQPNAPAVRPTTQILYDGVRIASTAADTDNDSD